MLEFWVIDVGRELLHVYRNPGDADYEEARELISPGLVPVRSLGVEIDLSRLFG